MKIAIIGTGHIGGTLGQRWRAAGHEVVYGSRAPSGTGPGGTPVLPADDAVTGADVVVLAVPGGAVTEVVAALGAALAGKVVIDAANRIGQPEVNSRPAVAAAAPGAGVQTRPREHAPPARPAKGAPSRRPGSRRRRSALVPPSRVR